MENPYAPPSAMLLQSAGVAARSGALTAELVDALRRTRFWVNVVAIAWLSTLVSLTLIALRHGVPSPAQLSIPAVYAVAAGLLAYVSFMLNRLLKAPTVESARRVIGAFAVAMVAGSAVSLARIVVSEVVPRFLLSGALVFAAPLHLPALTRTMRNLRVGLWLSILASAAQLMLAPSKTTSFSISLASELVLAVFIVRQIVSAGRFEREPSEKSLTVWAIATRDRYRFQGWFWGIGAVASWLTFAFQASRGAP